MKKSIILNITAALVLTGCGQDKANANTTTEGNTKIGVKSIEAKDKFLAEKAGSNLGQRLEGRWTLPGSLIKRPGDRLIVQAHRGQIVIEHVPDASRPQIVYGTINASYPIRTMRDKVNNVEVVASTGTLEAIKAVTIVNLGKKIGVQIDDQRAELKRDYG